MSKAPGLHFNSGEVPFPPLSITITSPEVLKAFYSAALIAYEDTTTGSPAEQVAQEILDACQGHAVQANVQLPLR